MRLLLVAALLLVSAASAAAQIPQRPNITAPVLKNRSEIIAERQRMAERYLQRGDSLLIRVFTYVDEKGFTHQPEVKTTSGNAKADTAAMLLVSKMVFQPAKNAKRGVLLTVPVKFVRR